MTITQSLYHTYQRFRTLKTDVISSLPIVILMPHSACNCRCIMCDIWKDNKNLRQLTEKDIEHLLPSLIKLGTRQVLMSGGEAILNPNFFRFCSMLERHKIRVTLLSTGLTLGKYADEIVTHVNDVIISLDGDRETHNLIRNIPGAFEKIHESVQLIRQIDPNFPITGRSVIHRLNFKKMPALIEAAKEMGLDKISFLPADVSSHAFNREVLWSDIRQNEILIEEQQLSELKLIIEKIITNYPTDFDNGFIAEQPAKLRKIHSYYAAFYGQNAFPYKKCNAPWVSTVVEADGTVRPCFFHPPLGNIHEQTLENILNGELGLKFRKELDMDSDSTCTKCVCYLNLSPGTKL
jgi:MoaA/NifB/PqqE/SkfB family radical SAM enzyme